MAICVCKCLNITLESEKMEANTENHKFDLMDAEQRDVFFTKVGGYPSKPLATTASSLHQVNIL